MNLEELQSVQSRERQASSLQHLRDTFYQDAGEYVQELHDRRDAAAAEADDPFGSEEVRRLSDDIDTAEHTVEAIYERRIGKIVKMASIAAADMPYDDDGLTAEETRLFDDLVESIERNRDLVLSVLDGETPGLTCSRPESGDETAESGPDAPSMEGHSSGVDTGAGTGTGTDISPEPAREDPVPPEAGETTPSPPEEFAIGEAMGGTEEPTADPPAAGASSDTSSDNAPDDGEDTPQDASVERATVRITADVGDIFGVDGRAYDLSNEDVVTLPTENATVLTEKGQAERLD